MTDQQSPDAGPAPPAIGPEAVVRPLAAVTAVAVGSVGLLIDTVTRETHSVNRTALAVWASLDGTSPLATVTDDLAAAFDLAPATVAADVQAVVGQFHQLGLVRVVGAGGAHDASDRGDENTGDADDDRRGAPCFRRDPVVIDGHHYVLVPPSNCQAGLDALGWAPVRAVAVGDHRLGVRGQSAATDALVQQVLARHLVDDPRVPPNFSVVLLDDDRPASGAAHPRSGLYEANQWVGGPTEHAAVLAALVRRLAASVPDSPPRLRLEALGVVGDRGVVLTPWYRGSLDPRVVALGERPGGALCPAPVWLGGSPAPGNETGGEVGGHLADPVVVVEPTSVEPDLSALGGPARPDGGEANRTEGRPVLAVVLPGPETARLEQTAAVAALVPWLTIAALDPVDTLVDLLVDLTARVPVLTAAPDDLPDVIVALTRSRAD